MTTILDIINQLRATKSKLTKEQILQENRTNEDLKNFFFLTLNPFINFFMRKKIVYVSYPVPDVTLDQAMGFLTSNISSRKVTGHQAIEQVSVLLSRLHAHDAQVIELILSKKTDCGCSVATANKIWPGLVPTYPCMLAEPFSRKLFDAILKKDGWVYGQLKSDGLRVNIMCDDTGNVTVYSRAGNELNVHGIFDALGKDFAGNVIDGELLTVNNDGVFNPRTISNGICSKAIKGTMSLDEAKSLHVVAWDVIPLDNFYAGVGKTPYLNRLETLTKIMESSIHKQLISISETIKITSFEGLMAFYRQMREREEEGCMAKSHSMIWEDKRSKNQLKVKVVATSEFRVVGYTDGVGHLQGNLGSLEISSEDGVVNASMSGFTLKNRSEIYASLTGKDVEYTTWENSVSTKHVAKPSDSDVKIGSVISVTHNGIVQDRNNAKSVFLPRFHELRTDKNTADNYTDILKAVDSSIN